MDAVERFAAGDVEAFEALFRRYQAEVYGWILRMVRQPAVAEDLTIETFWRIYERRQRFDSRRPFGPWARRIATRIALDHLKSENLWSSFDPERLAAPVAPDAAYGREIGEGIEKAFRGLSAPLKAAATLALIEERPYEEIADALEISVSAVKMRVSRAVRRLRRSLEAMGIR